MSFLRALLIDDEPPACDVLRALLSDHPQISVMGEAGTIREALTLLARDDYDLVFLDIQLRGGTGFDLVPHVRNGARIIFVTAFDAHALRAFEVNALDYLLKPVAPERLTASLARLQQNPSANDAPQPLHDSDRVLLKLGSGSERFVLLSDIRLIVSCENYSDVTLNDGEHFLVRKTMKAWETSLPATHFLRVHRTAIVNVVHITRIDRVTDSTSRVHLDGVVDPVIASYRYLPELRDAMDRRRG